MKKRIITMLLAVAMVFSAMTTAYAADGDGVKPRGVFAVSLMILSHESNNAGSFHFGHSSIMVFNYSSFSIEVGYMTVEPGDYVSVGIYGTEYTPAHGGVWYNIEANNIDAVKLLPADKYAAAACDITQNGLAALNVCIKNNDYYSLPSHNCTHFAQMCWNSAVPSNLNIELVWPSPSNLVDHIKALNLPMPQLPTSKPDTTIAFRGPYGTVYDRTPFGNIKTYALLFA